MYKVFFLNRSFSLCEAEVDVASDPEAIVYHNAPSVSVALDEFIRRENIHSLYVPLPDLEKSWNEFRSLFTEVNAGGGVIRRANPQSGKTEYLMIHRLGVWDLPKGKQEQGEKMEETALREVQEECGVPAPVLGKLICVTHHTYHRDGYFYLKHTFWYEMSLDGDVPLRPQTEEDITEAVWVPQDEIFDKMLDTYPSIREVMKKILPE